PFAEAVGDVLAEVAPGVAAPEHALRVAPLAGGAVEGARVGHDGEVADRDSGGQEADLGVGGDVADEGDVRVSVHGGLPGLVGWVERGAALARPVRGSPSGRWARPGSSGRGGPARARPLPERSW